MDEVAWTGICDEAPLGTGPPADDSDVDVVVVGGGFSGLSVALHAARRGLSVALLERERIGHGASGRNGGFVVPHYPGNLSPSAVEKVLGERRGGALNALMARAAGMVFDRIREHRIRCDAVQSGWLQPAHCERAERAAARACEQWSALGADVAPVDAAGMSRLIGSTRYRGGWIGRDGGHVNPYALCFGLARAAREAGVSIFESSGVDSMARADGRWVARVGRASVRARKIFIATNAYTDPAWGAVRRAVVPMRLFGVVSAPITSNVRAGILPEGHCVSDLRRLAHFSRLDRAGRLMTASVVWPYGDARANASRLGAAMFRDVFPQIGDVRIEHYWEGHCTLSASHLPELVTLGPDRYALHGFSARGLALSIALGPVLAELLDESIGHDALPIAVDAPRADPLFAVKRAVLPVASRVFGLMDRLDRLS